MPPRDAGSPDSSEATTEADFDESDTGDPSPPDHLRIDRVLTLNRGAWLCAAMLSDWYGASSVVAVPSPPAVLEEEDLEHFREQLVEFMPKDSLICGLLDWDIQFHDLMGDDWFFTAVFGPPSTLADCSDELAEFFMSKAVEYGLDLGVVGHEEEQELVSDAATDFVQQWRHQTIRRFLPDTSDSPKTRSR